MDDHDLCDHAVAYLIRPDSDERLPSLPVYGWEDGFVVLFDGNFDASLILVDALWDRALADFAPNGFVAALPHKNALAFCDSRTPTGPQQLRRFIEDAGIADHPITTTLYYRDPTRRDWRPYRDPASFLN